MRKHIFEKIFVIFVLLSIDLLTIYLSYLIAYFIRSEVFPQFFHRPPVPIYYYTPYAYLIFVWPLVFAYEGLYTKRISLSEETIRIWRGATIATVFIILLIYALRAYIISRAMIGIAWICTLIILPPIRGIVKTLFLKMRIWEKNLIIVGTGRAGRLLARNLRKTSSAGYRVIGIIESEPTKVGESVEGVKVLGTIGEMQDFIKETDVDGILIASPSLSKKLIEDVVEIAESAQKEVYVVPDFLGLRTQGLSVEHLDNMTFLKFKNSLMNPLNSFIKRIFDLLVSIILFILLLPIFVISAILIKLDSKGPIFYIQKRIGKGGKLFSCIKFRTMYVDADEKFRKFLKEHPEAQEEWKSYMKLKSFPDPRITRVGKFLRKWSIDELPQLLNVMLGHMSLVGPRPYLPREKVKLGRFFRDIISIRPGITGLWQVSGRSELSFTDRITLDEFYVRNWNLWLDVIILLKTMGSVLKKEGAY
jgi:undecaprenyl-phosphate galactose phosphotransferase